MKIEHEGNNLRVSDIAELNAINASSFRDEVRAAMPADPEMIEIDLSQTRFVDSSGLSVMLRTRKYATRQGVKVQFTGLQPNVLNVIRLSRLEAYLLQNEA